MKQTSSKIDVKALLKEAGLKLTSARESILECLLESDYPLTTAEIYQKIKLQDSDLSTIYRNVKALTEAGLIKQEVNSDKENIYSLNEEKDEHVLVCLKCKKRIKIPECPYHEANEKLEKETGFEVVDHNIEIYGYCPDCHHKH